MTRTKIAEEGKTCYVQEETLSDNSKVYNVVVAMGNAFITIPCYTKTRARIVFDAIENHRARYGMPSV